MKFFGSGSKKSSPTKKSASSHFVADERRDAQHPRSEPASPTKSQSRSPKKSSSYSLSSSANSSSRHPSNPADPPGSGSSRPSRPSRSSRHSTDSGSSSFSSRRQPKFDPDAHPLNLPPEERKRLSALAQSAMSGRNSMDVDQEPVNGAKPSSPQPSAQTNFSVPIPNGTNHQEAPAPPPHRSNPSSPVPTPEDDAEAYKAAGNRFFKEKNYAKAIEQYSKGLPFFSPCR